MRTSLHIPLGSVDEVPSPRASPRVDGGGQADSIYGGVMRETAFKGIVARLGAIEETVAPLRAMEERMKSLEDNIEFLVQVVRQNSHNTAFKLLGEPGPGGDDDEEDPSAASSWCCWPRASFL